MFGNKTLERLGRMLDDAIAGTFQEGDYDETKLSRLESRWKQYLAASALSGENLRREKENVKSLVSDISHQTKTPMTNLKMYTALLEENLRAEMHMESREESMEMLQEILRQTEKMEFLIQSLTKISRLETNIVEVRPAFQEISVLLAEAEAGIRQRAANKEIRIRNIYTGNGSACYDLKWTKEALENILDNAVKYSPCGSEILMSVTEYEMYVAVSVKDRGRGIREEDVPKIFGRFYRAEDVQQEEGVGIGLYLAREILKKENGYIKVKSAEGEGAEFILYLPRNK
ncbi:MAG: HAMP domain-containing histidine kinase [Ruminococcus sp.]|uniref:histidine kinase n=1 Tax=Schaedlerella arabinosiphila TaxID=2044587 RepID=A0A3R8L1E3_9FIRM|nr:HAMP domain-containing sensor histidine kinase [Schaedlerella arabinosiphila]MCI8724082.1 HAMP domain-containing histidine kinase [Ruminococcus sp.]MDE7066325.1 HAMP domain-containing histidine kinase [Schaedlerella arabinosiphila]RRK34364.1 sensor histidine kinase [Schaedlerella arabinosiphila]